MTIEWLGLVVLVAIGYFSLGFIWGRREVLRLRIRLIELEHDLALAQGRRPKTIDELLQGRK